VRWGVMLRGGELFMYGNEEECSTMKDDSDIS